jgi:predicted secreted Zn-dependent protease
MKRRTARQLVRLLSDIRHATHCSTLRAAATNRAIALASAEHDADADSDDNTDATRDARRDKPARSGS